jgi:radical SAM superfamily enzyme YgiQ (UPF0313 family)
MYFAEPIYRPPSERDSLLLQVTIGCSRPHCTFCYFSQQQARFRVRKDKEIFADIDEAADAFGDRVNSLFLMAADPSVLPSSRLIGIADYAYNRFPSLQRISLYAYATDFLRKSDTELAAMRESGIEKLFVGVESGSDAVLEMVRKGASAKEISRGCLRAIEHGFTVSTHVILGLGGRTLTEEHARETAELISFVAPHFVGFLTLMVYPETELGRAVSAGTFAPLTDSEVLSELERIIAGIETKERPIRITANCSSNYVDLSGVLPAEKSVLLRTIAHAHERMEGLRPEIGRYL